MAGHLAKRFFIQEVRLRSLFGKRQTKAGTTAGTMVPREPAAEDSLTAAELSEQQEVWTELNLGHSGTVHLSLQVSEAVPVVADGKSPA